MQMLGWSKPQTQEEVPKKGDPQAKIHLVSFKAFATMHSSGTPFGAKVEMMLRLAGLPYTAHNGNVQDPKTAPKSKFPVLYHGDNVVPDSSAIVEYLHNTYPTEMAVFVPKDPIMKATSEMARRMLEEHTYFCMLYMNWQRDDVWERFGPVLLADVPAPIRPMIMNLARGSVLRDLHGQGMGRHSVEEVMSRLAQDFDTFEAMLQHSGSYLSGPTVTAADCMLWGILDMIKASESIFPTDKAPPYVKLLKERAGLMAFYGLLKHKVFPEGPSKNWSEEMWNPAKGTAAAPAAAAAAS